MRRHHRPAFLELDPPVDNFSLLLGAEVDRAPWKSSALPTPPPSDPSRQASEESSKASDIKDKNVPTTETRDDSEEPSPGFLGRVDSYSRTMRAHMLYQLQSPNGGTLPSYRRTMHAHTLHQLKHYQPSSKSAESSPISETKEVQLSTRPNAVIRGFTREDVPRAPMNTPEYQPSCARSRRAVGSDVHGIDFRKLKRSVTEPQGGSCLLLRERTAMAA